MVSYIQNNVDTNEDFVIFFTSNFITCFIDFHLHAFGFNSGIKSQSIACLLRESEHLYWILGLQGESHSLWDLWTSGLQECKGGLLFFLFFEIGRGGKSCWSGSKEFLFLFLFLYLVRLPEGVGLACPSLRPLSPPWRSHNSAGWARPNDMGSNPILNNSPPTLTGVGHQWTMSTSTSCNQWFSRAKSTLKVAPTGRNH